AGGELCRAQPRPRGCRRRRAGRGTRATSGGLDDRQEAAHEDGGVPGAGGAGGARHGRGRGGDVAHAHRPAGETGGGMNGRALAAFIGLLTVGLGLIGLAYPLHVRAWVGFSPPMPKPTAGTVEARALYGGLFLVLGIFTLWAATSPRAHRSELFLIACLWLGGFAGRVVGV